MDLMKLTNMKESENKKSTWALGISIVAILLCLLIFVLWAFEVMPHSVVTVDSFIGACVALLGVIVTLAVGWQIYNAVEVKAMIKDYANKQEEINTLQNQLKDELKRLKIETEYATHHSLHLHAVTMALNCGFEQKYSEACYHCLEALAECAQMKEPMNAIKIIEKLDYFLGKMKKETKLSKSSQLEIKAMNKIIRASEHFRGFEDKYEDVIAKYLKKVGLEFD